MIHWNEIELDYKPRNEIFEMVASYPGEPEMTIDQSAFVCGLLNKYTPHKIMEVGIAGGGTTAIILDSLCGNGQECDFYSIDWSERFYRDETKQSGFIGADALNELKPTKIKHRFLFGKVACEWAEELALDDIDCLILDTMHVMPGEVLDFITLLPFLKNGAIVILHDTAFNLISRVKYGYATAVLFSSVTAEKYINYDCDNNIKYPNIAAFEVNDDTRKNIDQLFLSLASTWGYVLRGAQLKAYSRAVEKYYGKGYAKYFELMCISQERSVITWERQYRFPFWKLKADDEKIIVYGAGKVGKSYIKQLTMSSRVKCVGWVDRNYDSISVDNVDNPQTIIQKEYDRIVIAVEDEGAVSDIKNSLEKMGVEKTKIIWKNPKK
jgi:hypothetical protein